MQIGLEQDTVGFLAHRELLSSFTSLLPFRDSFWLGRAYPTHKRIQSLGLHHEYSLDETLHVELPGAWHSGDASDEIPGLDAAVYLVMVAYEASLPSEIAG